MIIWDQVEFKKPRASSFWPSPSKLKPLSSCAIATPHENLMMHWWAVRDHVLQICLTAVGAWTKILKLSALLLTHRAQLSSLVLRRCTSTASAIYPSKVWMHVLPMLLFGWTGLTSCLSSTLGKCLCQHRTKKTRVHFMHHPVPCCSEWDKNMKVVSSLQNIEERTSNKKSNKHMLILVTCNDEHCHHVWGHRTGSCFLLAKFETLS